MGDMETLLRTLLANGRFQEFLAMELLAHDSAAGTVTIKLPWRRDFERGPGTEQWHGGLIAALIDIAGDFALITQLGQAIPTINLRIDYLRPAIKTDLVATGRVLRAGKSIGTVDIDVADNGGKIIAVGRGTYSTLVPGR
jgi:uncharacterized protein (TIGR00369 family)